MAQAGQTVNEQPYHIALAISLSDSTTYADPVGAVNTPTPPFIPDAWYVGVSGDVTIVDMNGNTALLKNCVQGTIYRIRATKFKTTGSTATNLVTLYW